MFTNIFKQNNETAKQEDTNFDSIGSYVLIGGMFLLPFFFLPTLTLSFSFVKMTLLACAVFAAFLFWIFGRLKSGAVRIPRSGMLAGLALVFGVTLIGVFFSPSPQASFTGGTYEIGTAASFLVLFLLAFLGAALFESRARLFYLYCAILLSFAVLFALEAAHVLLGNDFFLYSGLDSATGSLLGKWNDLALYAGFAALLSLITLLRLTIEKKMRIFFYCILCLALLTLVVVNFTLVWGIVGAFALIISVYHFSFGLFDKKGAGSGNRAVPALSIAVLLLSIFFIFSGDFLQGPISEALQIRQIDVRPAWSSTFEVLKGTWKENLLLGSGPNLFVNQWLAFKHDAVNNSLFWDTDFRFGIGLLPTFAVTMGLLGTLAWLIFLGALLYRGVRAFLLTADEFTHYLIVSLFALIIYLFVAMIFYVPSLPLVALAFLLSGCFVSIAAHKKMIKTFSFSYLGDPRIGFAAVTVLIFLLIGVVIAGYTVAKRFAAFLYFERAQVAFEVEGDINSAKSAMVRAAELYPSDMIHRALIDVRLAEMNALFQKQDIPQETLQAEFQTLLGYAIASGNEAIRLNGTDYANWFALARIYASLVPLKVDGAYESAKAALAAAKERNPKSPRLALEEARLEIAHGNREEARALVSEALRLKPNYNDAIFVLAQLDIDAGNVKGAIVSLEQAALLNPNDAGLFFRLGLLKYNEEEYSKAVAVLERAVGLVSDYANARYFLGLTYYRLDRISDAILQFEAVQSTNPDNEEVKNIIANLKSGRSPLGDPEVIPESPPIEE